MNLQVTLALVSGNKSHIPVDLTGTVKTECTPLEIQHWLSEFISLLHPVVQSIGIHCSAEVTDITDALKRIHHQRSNKTLQHQVFSARENEVFGCIIRGYTNKQIAQKLFISTETVRTHRKHLLAKTSTRNTAALVNYYYQHMSREK